MFSQLFPRPQPKLPRRPLKLPHIVAAHERHHSSLVMKSMTNRAVYAQTAEGHTPAWSEPAPKQGIWTSFISSVRKFMSRALSAFRTPHSTPITYPNSRGKGEDLIRRALEQNDRRVRFYEGNPVWVYDQTQPVHVQPGIERYETVAELSPRLVLSAGWTVAARGAHARGDLA
ncbi:hypothetical protein B0J17DRAFT_628877 [Rhizoctonia solani]|nr:hypothetical protein B0J17DRAFT_628877 [Rhizoctonia solani]